MISTNEEDYKLLQFEDNSLLFINTKLNKESAIPTILITLILIYIFLNFVPVPLCMVFINDETLSKISSLLVLLLPTTLLFIYSVYYMSTFKKKLRVNWERTLFTKTYILITRKKLKDDINIPIDEINELRISVRRKVYVERYRIKHEDVRIYIKLTIKTKKKRYKLGAIYITRSKDSAESKERAKTFLAEFSNIMQKDYKIKIKIAPRIFTFLADVLID